mgnify:CR=1 FL=1
MTPPKPEPPYTPPLGIDDTELIRRAVMFAGTTSAAPDAPRWAVVEQLAYIQSMPFSATNGIND